jgi:GMP synthase (glutamine-hydrolysing)
MAGRDGGNGATARSPDRRVAGSLECMVSEHEAKTVVDTRLRQAVGYTVGAPEGRLGIVQAVPLAGRRTRPLHLAVLEHEAETGLGTLAGYLDAAGVEYDVLKTHQPFSAGGDFDGVIVLGGSLSVDDVALDARRWLGDSVQRGLPCVAVCLGAQLLADALGARVTRGRTELGAHDIYLLDGARHDPLFADLPRRVPVFSFHQDRVDLPRRAVPLAGSLNCTYHPFRYGVADYGFQFHPEIRRKDIDRWRNVPGYRRLVEERDEDWGQLAEAVEAAVPERDRLAHELLNRWLRLTAAVTTQCEQSRPPRRQVDQRAKVSTGRRRDTDPK